MTQSFYQVSLVAAYVAGIVALFAPCCISYLLPAYLGNVFKEKKRILFMTFVYSLGILVVMLPVVLGAKALSNLFFKLHDQTYLIGGIVMLFISFLAFLGIKMPMPKIALKQEGVKNDIVSTFTLGVFSGITSSCCAPVLIGVIALSSLTPTIISSIGVGAAYVFGMVTPLYLASLFIDKRNVLEKPILKEHLGDVSFLGKSYPIFISNIVSFLIFFVTGALMLTLTLTGSLALGEAEAETAKKIGEVAMAFTDLTNKLPIANVAFAIVGLYLLYRLIRKVL